MKGNDEFWGIQTGSRFPSLLREKSHVKKQHFCPVSKLLCIIQQRKSLPENSFLWIINSDEDTDSGKILLSD